uniref:Ionotropic glutamate receptor C-terminal domain-containing protein n=1 Tax=Daphnia galeata TaxID=27404 RepID=A0A8J2RJA7_9CRUS|nr:unnamed protein product [Daphnia galeata]
MNHFPMLILWLTIIAKCGFSSSMINPLNGQHLRVIWPLWSGNPKGLRGPLKGGVALEFLSARLNFTYEMVRVREIRLEPEGKEGGLFSYLWDQRCDLLITDVPPPFYRSKIDMTTPWVFSYYGLLIPVNDDTANINAVVKPFQWPVWLGLGVSIVCVTAILILILRFSSHLPKNLNSNTQVESSGNDNLESQDGRHPADVTKDQSGKQYLYVIGNLLSQGGSCPSNRLPFRLVAGVWCLAAFIFVQAYNSTLFTYVVTPVNQPLVNSINDVLESNDIQLLVMKASPLEVLSMNPNATGLFLKLGKKLRSSANSRCKLKSECISAVTPESRNVYVDPVNFLKDVIKEDFNKTGKCNLQLAKEGFMPTATSFALPKNSPYTKTINRGLLELQQIGLIDFWDTWFRPMPPQCNGKDPTKTSGNKLSALSFKNLTGAFLLLAVGLSLSLLVFLLEQIYYRFI